MEEEELQMALALSIKDKAAPAAAAAAAPRAFQVSTVAADSGLEYNQPSPIFKAQNRYLLVVFNLVKSKILERMEEWTEMFSSNPDFGIMEQAYMKLKTTSARAICSSSSSI
jgi:hypothetical protein